MSNSPQLAEPQLNATPLIDVLLVLIVMMIITLPIATHAVKLNLPGGTHVPPPPTVNLGIYAQGDIYWNDERIPSIAALQPRLTAVASMTKPPLVRVTPEKRARYELVAQVLAAAQRSHVEALSLTPVADTP